MSTRCMYCDLDIEETSDTLVPGVRDDEQWAELAKEHAPDCEWILTRAHRREEQNGSNQGSRST